MKIENASERQKQNHLRLDLTETTAGDMAMFSCQVTYTGLAANVNQTLSVRYLRRDTTTSDSVWSCASLSVT